MILSQLVPLFGWGGILLAWAVAHGRLDGVKAIASLTATVPALALSATPVLALQPLAAQVNRLVATLDYVGAPLSVSDRQALDIAMREPDEVRANVQIQQILDRLCLFDVYINPERRVTVTRGVAQPELIQHGWRTFLLKVRNDAGVTAALTAKSPQAQPVFSQRPTGSRLGQQPPQNVAPREAADRWLDLNLFDKPPLTPTLSGLAVEYRVIQLYSRDAGERDATIRFSVGQSAQGIGLPDDLSVLFRCKPAREIVLHVLDEHDQSTTASFVIRDLQGRLYPSSAKRLAPDFAFQPQVYRTDGERLLLPVGSYEVEFTRGPEYVRNQQILLVEDAPAPDWIGLPRDEVPPSATFRLQRWIDTSKLGWYSGDHHIHAAGCLHYETPTQGVFPQDMLRHVVGEGLNVAAILNWAQGYHFQKQFFEGKDHQLSTPDHLMHYDLEVSGFPSSHAGHLVLLRLKDAEYPGAKAIEDWPTWNLPILRWAKAQGAVVGYAHSAWGLEVKSTELPNYELPKFDGIGANEFIMDVTFDAVDFISAVDTPARWELNIWYHTLNAGFRTRIAGETDFPCIYGRRVGMGRSYVNFYGALKYDRWVEGIRAGRSYVSDGKSHLIDFRVDGRLVGTSNSELRLDRPSSVHITVRAAARLEATPEPVDRRAYWDLEKARLGSTREVPVEVVVNGVAVATQNVVADGGMRNLAFDVPIQQSSWIALRILPSSHTNPIFVIIRDAPIRASRASAEWCLAAVDRCWTQKRERLSTQERPAAEQAYEFARRVYRRRIVECVHK
jgi:hypothetical protein